MADPSQTGFNGDGIPATQSRLNFPVEVDVDAAGTIYIADTRNHRIRRVFLGAPVQDVEIDIKPGSVLNGVNPRSQGLLLVAILTTEDLNAAEVDPSSVRLGPGGAGIAHPQGHLEDLDGDGDLDLLVHFPTADTGVSCETTELKLAGTTIGGQEIAGRDHVRPVGCRP